MNDVAYLLDGLMQGLGFKEYMAQGGDIGSDITFALAKNHECCKSRSSFLPSVQLDNLVSFFKKTGRNLVFTGKDTEVGLLEL